MRAARLLVLLPAVVVIVLLQAAWWVPTYQDQGTGNPARLNTFIEASSGDARILNPLLNADTASARISDLVFDGLLDFDEDLNLRPALARAWRISEYAYLAAAPGEALGPAGDTAALRAAIDDLLGTRGAGVLEAIDEDMRPALDTGPRRWLRLDLNRVVPELERRLRPLLGDRAVVVHNPVIEFTLRRDVRFHDGHVFDAEDVRFTYEAVMNPANLSPRRADFEPVATLEVVDSQTVRVTYARLFSPAVNAWTIGILPAHRFADAGGAGAMRNSGFNRAPIGPGAYRFGGGADRAEHVRRLRGRQLTVDVGPQHLAAVLAVHQVEIAQPRRPMRSVPGCGVVITRVHDAFLPAVRLPTTRIRNGVKACPRPTRIAADACAGSRALASTRT